MCMGRTVAGAIAFMAAAMLGPARVQGQWEVEYYANSLVYPENSGTGWVFYDYDPGNFQRGFVGNTLWENTMPPGDPWAYMGWQNTSGTFNFAAGFVMEARLKMVDATNNEPRWGGASIHAVSDAGYNMGIEVDPDKVILGSIFNYVSYPMDTTDAFHTYRAEAQGNYGRLYVDGIPRLELALASDNPSGWISFGDQGWEGGEMYFEHVRYGGVPAPATAVLLVASAMTARRRRPHAARA